MDQMQLRRFSVTERAKFARQNGSHVVLIFISVEAVCCEVMLAECKDKLRQPLHFFQGEFILRYTSLVLLRRGHVEKQVQAPFNKQSKLCKRPIPLNDHLL